MKKLVFFAIMAVVLVAIGSTTTSCKDKKSVADSIRIDSLQVDTTTRDTLESIIEEQPMPKAADELFDDFVFNFAANRKLQLTRIKFPLDVYQNDKVVKRIEKKDWRMEHFFMKQGYYTLIFDNVKQMDLVKDTTIDHVVIEKITFKNKSVKQYLFNRINGQWTLTSMCLKHISETTNASFLQFYQRFASDSAFQVQSLNDLVEFTAPDPDDDFSSITGSITPEQWPSFKPWLIPDGEIYRGVANGMETEMNFKVVKGKWKLMKFNS